MTASRREFLQRSTGTATVLAGLTGNMARLRANPLGLPVGLQLWAVRKELEKNYDATLRKIAEIGYREIELFELPTPVAAYRKKFADAGLSCVSGHFELDSFKSQTTIDAAKEIGLRYMIVVFPTLRNPKDANLVHMTFDDLIPLYEKISLDDYKWNAEQLNRYGAVLKRNGLQLGYHNHAVDFKKFGEVVALDLLIQSTDPSLVVFELDCGHVVHAGYAPIAYLKKYPTRIQLLHLKDLKPGFAVTTSLAAENMGTNAEIGDGVIQWKELFRAAKQASVKHYFVEHEGKMSHPPLEAIANSYQYLQNL
jgi:sugar phosphate isomerase/epimerase